MNGFRTASAVGVDFDGGSATSGAEEQLIRKYGGPTAVFYVMYLPLWPPW